MSYSFLFLFTQSFLELSLCFHFFPDCEIIYMIYRNSLQYVFAQLFHHVGLSVAAVEYTNCFSAETSPQ